MVGTGGAEQSLGCIRSDRLQTVWPGKDKIVVLPDDEHEFFFDKPWSDGLPVVIPTGERIEDMCEEFHDSICTILYTHAWNMVAPNG